MKKKTMQRTRPSRKKEREQSQGLPDGFYNAKVTELSFENEGPGIARLRGGQYLLQPPWQGAGRFDAKRHGLETAKVGDSLLIHIRDGRSAEIYFAQPAAPETKPLPPDLLHAIDRLGDGGEAPATNPKTLHGATKPDLTLIPPVAIAHMAMAMEHGAEKYGAYNWRSNQVEARTYVAAALRHLCDWLDGQEVAIDSGVNNLAAAMANCAIVLDAQAQGNLIDNRPIAGKSAVVMEAFRAQKASKESAG